MNMVPGEYSSLKNKVTSHDRDMGHAGLVVFILKLDHNYIIFFSQFPLSNHSYPCLLPLLSLKLVETGLFFFNCC